MKGLVRTFAAIALLALMVMPFLGGTAAASKLAAPAAATQPVELQDYKFVPPTITINVGDTITFVNKGAVAHTATAGDGSWDSGNMDSNATFNHTFSTAGSFVVYCRYHGSANGSGMAMTVTVAQAAAATATSAPAATATSAPAATATSAPAATATSAPAPAATDTAAPAPAATATSAPAGETPTAAASTFPTGEADSVTADDQPAGPTITLKEVHANVAGWIAVHANTADNKPGAVLGHTAVKVGDNYNVVVQLSPAPVAGDKVWPMLHIDAGVMGTYEFPGPDAPVIINGNIVMKQITLTAASSSSSNSSSNSSSSGTTPALPTTGNGGLADLWPFAVVAAMLILAGSLLLRRRTA